MITWKDYLAMLAEDGVTLDHAQYDALTDDGHVVESHFLSRWHKGRLLNVDLPYDPSLDDRVPRYLQRQIANRLRLPKEKYIDRTY